MRYVVETPEDQPDTYLVYYMVPRKNTLIASHSQRDGVDRLGVSIPPVIGALMAMCWRIAYGLAHH
jgi:hypothetical protein